jgi:hypothetical protein
MIAQGAQGQVPASSSLQILASPLFAPLWHSDSHLGKKYGLATNDTMNQQQNTGNAAGGGGAAPAPYRQLDMEYLCAGI